MLGRAQALSNARQMTKALVACRILRLATTIQRVPPPRNSSRELTDCITSSQTDFFPQSASLKSSADLPVHYDRQPAKSSFHLMQAEASSNDKFQTYDGVPISLGSPTIAAILAFVFPGAGHAYQGRTLKALLYSVCILGLFFSGLWIGQGKVVYSSWTKEDFRWQYALQAAVGLPAAPAAVQAYWIKHYNQPLASGWMAKPNSLQTLSDWHYQSSAGFDLGTLYTMIAGILNLLVVFDAYSGPLPPPKQNSKKNKKTPAAGEPASKTED